MKNRTDEDHMLFGLHGIGKELRFVVPTNVYKTIQDFPSLKAMTDELTLVWEGDGETQKAEYHYLTKSQDNNENSLPRRINLLFKPILGLKHLYSNYHLFK